MHLVWHLLTHFGQKPCNFCDYASFETDNLGRHLKHHSGGNLEYSNRDYSSFETCNLGRQLIQNILDKIQKNSSFFLRRPSHKLNYAIFYLNCVIFHRFGLKSFRLPDIIRVVPFFISTVPFSINYAPSLNWGLFWNSTTNERTILFWLIRS